MYDLTPQERLALIVIATLICAGAVGRHVAHRADARDPIQFTADAADTLSAGSARRLRGVVEDEVERNRVRDIPLAEGERIDPNNAPVEQLDRLPGIGPAIADRIVVHRRESGPFRTVGDLGLVRGIGPAALERIAPFVTLPPGPTRGTAGVSRRIDLNRAGPEELGELPGVGPALAKRIVEHRESQGRFRNWRDLENVPGIGPNLRQRLEGAARLGP